MPQHDSVSAALLALPRIGVASAVAFRAIHCIRVHLKLSPVRAFGRLVRVRTDLFRAACFASSVHFALSIAE